MEVNIAPGVGIDAQQVITGRGCVIGQSGSGKSYLVGVIAEELCRLGLPFCIIDTEGEYSSLRNSFAVLLVGDEGADLNLDTDMGPLFSRSISYGVPVILDVSESAERAAVVERALAALYEIESRARKPYLVVVEEADKFAPQVTHQRMNIVEELSVRGRKRGIGLLVATQRPSNISKNVLAQCSYGFVGKLVIENDMKAVSTLFGGKTDLGDLATQVAGEFTPFGIPHTGKFHAKARTTAAQGGTPVVAVSGAAKEKLGEMIRELSARGPVSGGAAGPAARAAQSTTAERSGALLLAPNFDEGYARDYAEKNERKRFGVLGKKTEAIENIGEAFIAIALIKIGIPTGRSGEYEERYVMLDDRLRVVRIDRRVSFIAAPAIDSARLSKKDLEVLREVASRRRVDIAALQKSVGIGPIALDHTLDRLETGGLVTKKNNRVTLANGSAESMRSPPRLVQVSALGRLLNTDVDENAAADRVRTLFPNATVLELTHVYMRVYETRLRHGSRVRILLVESLNGRELPDFGSAR